MSLIMKPKLLFRWLLDALERVLSPKSNPMYGADYFAASKIRPLDWISSVSLSFRLSGIDMFCNFPNRNFPTDSSVYTDRNLRSGLLKFLTIE